MTAMKLSAADASTTRTWRQDPPAQHAGRHQRGIGERDDLALAVARPQNPARAGNLLLPLWLGGVGR
jgi:hypothetical protein